MLIDTYQIGVFSGLNLHLSTPNLVCLVTSLSGINMWQKSNSTLTALDTLQGIEHSLKALLFKNRAVIITWKTQLRGDKFAHANTLEQIRRNLASLPHQGVLYNQKNPNSFQKHHNDSHDSSPSIN